MSDSPLDSSSRPQLIGAGEHLPDFSLADAAGALLTRSSFAGTRVAFFFVPQAFTGICGSEVEWLLRHMERFEACDTEPVIVSCDSRSVLREWLETLGAGHLTALSDFWPHGEFTSSCGAFDVDSGVPQRATVVVDVAGVVLWSESAAAHEPRHLSRFLSAVETV